MAYYNPIKNCPRFFVYITITAIVSSVTTLFVLDQLKSKDTEKIAKSITNSLSLDDSQRTMDSPPLQAQSGQIGNWNQITIYIDPDTGCHYLSKGQGVNRPELAPRLKKDGTFMCD